MSKRPTTSWFKFGQLEFSLNELSFRHFDQKISSMYQDLISKIFSGTPKDMGPLKMVSFPYYEPISFRDSGTGSGFRSHSIREIYHFQGSHYLGGSLESPLDYLTSTPFRSEFSH